MRNSTDTGNKIIDYARLAIIGLLAIFLLLELALSLSWRMQHDTPILHYIAFLIDKHNFIPYKDVFETSMPGAFLLHLAIGHWFGYSDLAFRIVDVAYLSLLLSITWFIMRPFGKTVASASILLFGLLYLSYGPKMSLQRDCVGILPIAMALFLVSNDFILINKANLRAFVTGALFGLSAAIKPHLSIGLPALIIYMALNVRPEKKKGAESFLRHLLKCGLFTVSGFILILSLPLLWLWNKGGIPYFWEMFSRYLPLYLHLTGMHQTISGVEWWIHLIKAYLKLGGMYTFLIPIVLGIYMVFSKLAKNSVEIKLVFLLITLLFLYSIYPVFAGQFWKYHWMPFAYFASLFVSFLLLPTPSVSCKLYKCILPLIVFAIFLLIAIHPAPEFVRQVSGQSPAPPKEGRVDEIADFLKTHLGPTDKVQPLDWVDGGAVHGMLIAQAVVATPYIQDFYFYHDISEPYIQEIRRRFIKCLKEEYPKYIIDIDVAVAERPTGKDTTTEFPELKKYISENYIAVYKCNGFKILGRKQGLTVP